MFLGSLILFIRLIPTNGGPGRGRVRLRRRTQRGVPWSPACTPWGGRHTTYLAYNTVADGYVCYHEQDSGREVRRGEKQGVTRVTQSNKTPEMRNAKHSCILRERLFIIWEKPF